MTLTDQTPPGGEPLGTLDPARAVRRARLVAARRRRQRHAEAANRRVRLVRGDVVFDTRLG